MILKMLITNTKVGRNTKSLVAGVSERMNRHPDAMTSVFTAVDFISNELASIIQSSTYDDDLEKERRVEELMEMNQGLLQCMGVSHASIDTVLRTTFKYKLTSKLTGAGGGGCVLTFLPARIHFKPAFLHTCILLAFRCGKMVWVSWAMGVPLKTNNSLVQSGCVNLKYILSWFY